MSIKELLYDIFGKTKSLFWNSSKEVLGKRKFPIVAFSFSKLISADSKPNLHFGEKSKLK